MKNHTFKSKEKEEIYTQLFTSMKGGTEEEQKAAVVALYDSIASDIEVQAQELLEEIGSSYKDEQVLVERGLIPTQTTEEREYFAEAIEKQTFENLDITFPETKVEDIFSRIVEEHPILKEIDMVSTKGLIKYIYTDPTKVYAHWDTLPADIKEIILNGFKEISLEVNKLSGYLAIPKGYFKLGPAWLNLYVTTSLTEIMSASLELAVVNGTGLKQPLGMNRKLSGITDEGYPEKEKIVMNDLDPETLGSIHGAMAEAKTDNGVVACLVHPQTYWAKLYPKLVQRDSNNNWHLTNLPTGDKIIPSYAVPKDQLIFGVLKNYFLGIGGAMEFALYRETLAIQDADLYVAKFHGNGVAKNPNAFFVGDITTIPGGPIVKLEGAADVKAPGTITNKKKKEKPEEPGE